MAFDEPTTLVPPRNAGIWRAAIHEYRWRRRIRESKRMARHMIDSVEHYKAVHLSYVKTVKEVNERWRRPDLSSSSAIVVRDELETEGDNDEFYTMLVTIDDEVERWAAGKHGNLLALLTALQNIISGFMH
ncbi:unnamed protein product [Linum trigynum]|uniref:Uncharacterized protein n=1 Tax=Linum trigynum TaxID=586398 RepID=A0AAV2GDX1_9ROSI